MPVTELAVAASNEGPYGVTLAGGELWTTFVHARVVARVRDDEIRRFDLGAPDSRLSVIVPGPDGAVWSTRDGDDRIGRIGPHDAVSAVEVSSAGSSPYGLCVGPDGALWFTLMSADRIGRLTMDGEVVEQHQLGAGSEPHGLALAAHRSVWVALESGVLAHIHTWE